MCGARAPSRDRSERRRTLLVLAAAAADTWSPPAIRDRLLSEVADLALHLLEKSDHRLAAVRALAATATTEPQLDALTGVVTDPDLRWRRLTRLAELDRLDEDEAVRLEREDPNPDAWQSALVARAARPDRQAKQAGWDKAFAEDNSLPPIAVEDLSRALWRPGQDTMLRPFADDFLRLLPAISERGFLGGLTLSALLPVAGIDVAYLDSLEAAAQRPAVSELVRQRVLEGSDRSRRMLRSRARTDP